MLCTEGKLTSTSGVSLFYRIWSSGDEDKTALAESSADSRRRVRAVVCVIHGMGEHGGRYEHLAELMVENGYVVFAMDQQGHGRSGGKRGHIHSLDSLVTDVELLIHKAQELYPAVPVFLYGHSMGGNVVLNCTLRLKPNIQGVIAASPWLRLAFEPPVLKRWLGQAAAVIAPGLHQKTGLQSDELFRKGYAKAPVIEGDPLNHSLITARTYSSIRSAGEWVLQHAAKQLQVPMLLLHGNADRVTSYEASKALAGSLGEACTWVSWDGGYHELHNDLEGEQVIRRIIDWIDETL